MNREEIREGCRYEYMQICNCGKKHQILTQRHDFPEYETEIYVLCDCGEYVPFELPVN